MNKFFVEKSELDIKEFAELLRTHLKDKHSFAIGQGKMLHLLAELNGFSSWQAYASHLGAPPEESITPITDEEIAEASRQYVRRYLEDDDTFEVVETFFGLVIHDARENIRSAFPGDSRYPGSLSERILTGTKNLSDACPAFSRSPIVNDIRIMCAMIDHVIYGDFRSTTADGSPRSFRSVVKEVEQQLQDFKSPSAQGAYLLEWEDKNDAINDIAYDLFEDITILAPLLP